MPPGDDTDHAATLERLGLTALPSDVTISDDDLLRRAEQRVAAHELQRPPVQD